MTQPTQFLKAIAWICLLMVVVPVVAPVLAGDADWPSFRGHRASGFSPGRGPTRWDVETSTGIAWKKPIPGLGHSCPIIWGRRLFVTTAVPASGKASLKVGLYGDIASVKDATPQTWRLYCLDKRDGATLWRRDLHKGVPMIKRHTKASHANSTPATDGRHVIAFLGSEGLYCYDMEGELLWKKSLGRLDSGFFRVKKAQWGFGSSPIIHEDMVVVQCDVQENSFVAALKVKDGSEVWRKPRDEVPTWSTPTIATSGDRTLLILNGYKHIGAYDCRSGAEIWKLRGGGDIPTPTPVVGHGMIFITNAHGRMSPIFAIRLSAAGDLGAAGDLTPGEHVAWFQKRGGTYMQTPLLLGDRLYFCDGAGRTSCYIAKTGERVYRARVGEGTSGFTASPVAIGETLYFTSENGQVHVVKAGPEFELIATNEMGEICMATPAASEGTLYFRTRGHVVAVGQKQK